MRSDLFAQADQDKETGQRFLLQNAKMLSVEMPGRVGAQGSMVAFQGRMEFTHQGAGSVAKMLRRWSRATTRR